MIKWLQFVWGGPPMPEHLRENLRAWAALHPDWDLTLWGDEDLRWLEHRDLYDDAARHVPDHAIWQFRSDIARYEILRKHAGMYVDTDVTPLRNIESAIEGHDAFAVAETPRWTGNTILYVDRPEHPVIVRILDHLRNNVARRRHGSASPMSGPKFITEHWKALGCYEAETRLFFPLSWTDARAGREADFDSLDPEVYTVHRWQHVRDLVEQGKVFR